MPGILLGHGDLKINDIVPENDEYSLCLKQVTVTRGLWERDTLPSLSIRKVS